MRDSFVGVRQVAQVQVTQVAQVPLSSIINFLIIIRSTSELNTQLNPTTCLGDTGCWAI